MEVGPFKLVICSGKGGVGKSMLVSALAMLFTEEKKVVAVDCDTDAPNLAIWLDEIADWQRIIPVVISSKAEIDYEKCEDCGACIEKCRFKAIELAEGKARVNRVLCEGCGACELVCDRGAISLKPVQSGEIRVKITKYGFPLVLGYLFVGEAGSDKMVRKIKKEADKFESDLQIIDTSPGTGSPVITALQDSSFTILIAEPTPSGFSDLSRILEVAEHFRIPWGLVINKWDINKEITKEMEEWADDKLLGKISYNQGLSRVTGDLTPVMKTDLKVREEIKRVFNSLKQALKGPDFLS